MRIGVQFPQDLIGHDPGAVRDYAQAAEDAGFDYLYTFEHVAGAHADRFRDADTGFHTPPYLYDDPFHEPFTLFAYLAGLTHRIEFATTVLVLPQRQTVLVAKQAAEVALLGGGRLRLGVGVGWNHAEYEALGADFHNRGRRVDEQINLLRRLWTEPLISSSGGRWHTLDRVGIAPLPPKPIPIWIGGGLGAATLHRVARLGDGWMPMSLGADPAAVIAQLHRYLQAAGRAPSSLGIQGNVPGGGAPDDWIAAARRWADLGATHLSVPVSGRGGTRSAMAGLQHAMAVRRAISDALGG